MAESPSIPRPLHGANSGSRVGRRRCTLPWPPEDRMRSEPLHLGPVASSRRACTWSHRAWASSRSDCARRRLDTGLRRLLVSRCEDGLEGVERGRARDEVLQLVELVELAARHARAAGEGAGEYAYGSGLSGPTRRGGASGRGLPLRVDRAPEHARSDDARARTCRAGGTVAIVAAQPRRQAPAARDPARARAHRAGMSTALAISGGSSVCRTAAASAGPARSCLTKLSCGLEGRIRITCEGTQHEASSPHENGPEGQVFLRRLTGLSVRGPLAPCSAHALPR
jgi:hypothetical protein